MRLPGMYSLATNRYGPEPTISVTGLNGSPLARRSGSTKSGVGAECASASTTTPIGRLSRMRKLRSSGLSMRSVKPSRAWPKLSRAPQRLIEATQSTPRTGVPSWNFRPSRRRKDHVRLSSETVWPSTICGVGRFFASTP